MSEISLLLFRFRLWGEAVNLFHVRQCLLKIDMKILQETVTKVENQAVHDGVAVLLVALLNGGSLDDVSARLNDVQFNESIVSITFIGDLVQLLLVQAIDVANVSQPRIQKAQVRGSESGFDSSTVVVTANDDMLHVKMSYGVVDYGHDTEVGIGDEIGDVAVDKQFTGLETHDFIGGDAAIAATNVEIVWFLSIGKLVEERGICASLGESPLPVVLEQGLERLLEIPLHVGRSRKCGMGGSRVSSEKAGV